MKIKACLYSVRDWQPCSSQGSGILFKFPSGLYEACTIHLPEIRSEMKLFPAWGVSEVDNQLTQEEIEKMDESQISESIDKFFAYQKPNQN